MPSILSQRAMLASVKISQWSANKHDARVTSQVNREHNAAADACRVNKRLVSKDALAAILKIGSRTRAAHYARTLPWADDGARVLSSTGYLGYAEAMRELKAEFEAAADAFTVAAVAERYGRPGACGDCRSDGP